MKTSDRSRKLSTEVQKILPRILLRFTDPAVHGLLTVTGVEISGDLGIARVFISQIGGSASPMKKLNMAKKRIAHEVALKVATRRIMMFRFEMDNTAEILKRLA